MGQYLLCGKVAKKPLHIRELGINIYTAEELCYYIYNNTGLLEDDFIGPRLIEFFSSDLGMPELAEKIIKYYETSADMVNVLVMIMRYIRYYNDNEINSFQDIMSRLHRKNQMERRCQRADLLLEKGRCECAASIYSNILQKRRDSRLKPQFYAQVFQHMAVAYARMGYAEEAMECLQAAYAETKDEMILKQMYFLSMLNELDFCEQLSNVNTEQLSSWNEEYHEAQIKCSRQAWESDVVRSICDDPEKNKMTADSFIAQQKSIYCHMVMNE